MMLHTPYSKLSANLVEASKEIRMPELHLWRAVMVQGIEDYCRLHFVDMPNLDDYPLRNLRDKKVPPEVMAVWKQEMSARAAAKNLIRDKVEVYQWFWVGDPHDFGSFEWLCALFGYDSEWARSRVIAKRWQIATKGMKYDSTREA